MRKHEMKKYLLAMIVVVVCLVYASFPLLNARPVEAETQQSAAVFDAEGKMKLPTGFRSWVFLGSPLTPNGLNNGKGGKFLNSIMCTSRRKMSTRT